MNTSLLNKSIHKKNIALLNGSVYEEINSIKTLRMCDITSFKPIKMHCCWQQLKAFDYIISF